ncbi:ubiquitin-specific protease UBP8 PWA37_001660 [Arxiozyma heterogenica]|uniref:ubiquitin-specific protease UBP8 n=1 Tax=Arxiozyma heterogenica TaxID=278026 RepID=UPI002EE76DDE
MTHCSHLNLLFNSNNELLKTYNLVKASIIFNDKLTWKDKILYLMECHTCHEFNAGTNFVCLQCDFCGCWDNKHFQTHAIENSHSFSVNSSNGLLFCFSCMDYIVNDQIMLADNNLSLDEISTILNKSHPPDQIRRDGLYGLVNMGSTCFMSSVLQILIHNKYIIQKFLSQDHVTYCTIKDGRDCMLCAFDTIISEWFGSVTENNNNDSHDGFLTLLTCVWSINKNYAGYSQQDVHEFLQFILNQLHMDYIKTSSNGAKLQKDIKNNSDTLNNSNNDDGKNTNNKDFNSCSCIVHATFNGTLKSSIVCSECDDNSKTVIEPYLDLSLDISGKKTLYECLESFHKREQLHDFEFHCPKCQTEKDPIKQLTINQLSPVLIFQLKRFKHLINGSNVKINDFVSFPLYLEMSNYCYDNIDYGNSNINGNNGEPRLPTPHIIYELTGIISHKGTVNEGHYTATVKLSSGQWFKFNDSMISLLKEEQVLQEQAYLLFFTVKQISK